MTTAIPPRGSTRGGPMNSAHDYYILVEADVDQDDLGAHGAHISTTQYPHRPAAIEAARRSAADCVHVQDARGVMVWPGGAL